MNPSQETQLLQRTLQRLDAAPAAARMAGIEVFLGVVALALGASALALSTARAVPTAAAIAAAFLAGLAAMLFLVKVVSTMQWRVLAPHVDRKSVEARLRLLGRL